MHGTMSNIMVCASYEPIYALLNWKQIFKLGVARLVVKNGH